MNGNNDFLKGRWIIQMITVIGQRVKNCQYLVDLRIIFINKIQQSVLEIDTSFKLSRFFVYNKSLQH